MRAISALDVDVIDLRVNSPGGDVFDGIAIMNALTRHPARVEATVDGLAASAASFLLAGADHVVMNSGSEIMIHEAWGWCGGDAADMRAYADQLERINGTIAGLYKKRAGGELEDWRAAMNKETWYSPEEAVTAGLADAWADAPAAGNSFDLSKFGYRGRDAASARASAVGVDRPVTGPANKEEDNMALRDDLIERFGLEAEATDEEILEAVDAAVDAADDDTNESDGGEAEGGDASNSVAASAANTVALDRGAFEQLQRDARAGAEALAAMNTQRREGIVAAAVADGRIAPSSRDTWLASLERDEAGAVALIGTLAKNTIPVSEIGRSDDVDSAEAKNTALLNKWRGKSEEGSK